jgi:hypothetical protein
LRTDPAFWDTEQPRPGERDNRVMPTWTPPSVTVVAVDRLDGDSMISLRVPPGLDSPLAPALLVDDGKQVVVLDAVVIEDGDTTVFRSRDVPVEDLVGRVVGLQQWWSPEAFDAATDVGRRWTHDAAPPPEHHEHCLLDWQTIEEGVGDGTGWQSRGEWVCTACYQRYFLDDELRIRGSRPSSN